VYSDRPIFVFRTIIIFTPVRLLFSLPPLRVRYRFEFFFFCFRVRLPRCFPQRHYNIRPRCVLQCARFGRGVRFVAATCRYTIAAGEYNSVAPAARFGWTDESDIGNVLVWFMCAALFHVIMPRGQSWHDGADDEGEIYIKTSKSFACTITASPRKQLNGGLGGGWRWNGSKYCRTAKIPKIP
jgi:hypothetical protein